MIDGAAQLRAVLAVTFGERAESSHAAIGFGCLEIRTARIAVGDGGDGFVLIVHADCLSCLE